MAIELTTLCYIKKGDCYLMLHRVKEEQDMNKGKWMGIGGHFEAKESPDECLVREVREETGLKLNSYQFRGIVTFMTDTYETEYMCLYTADSFEGEITECTEGVLEWVPQKEVYNLNMWEGDHIFLKLLEERESFFSLKLKYEGDKLVEAVLDGEMLSI